MKTGFLGIFIAYLPVIVMPMLSPAQTQTYWIENKSYTTNCAEHDNVNIPMYGPVGSTLIITATHPPYNFTDSDCPPDNSGSDCNTICKDSNYTFTPDSNKIYDDDGINVIWVYSTNNFWRPNRMKVIDNNGKTSYGNYLAVSKKIENRNEWPQFLILYCDSYIRLIPQPPQGLIKTCFGSSVIIGPAEGIKASTCNRPYADIDSVLFNTVNLSGVKFNIWYHDGSTASVNASVTTKEAKVEIKTNFTSNRPLAAFRSMWISSSNCDADSIACESGKFPLLSNWSSLQGKWFKIFRSKPSVHNNSAPDIKIEVPNTVNVSSSDSDIPAFYSLYQNYPNPFNPSTVISYQLPTSGYVSLKVYDLLGREVASLVNEEKTAGNYSIKFDGSKLSGGIYFYRLQAGKFISTKEMVLIK